jgi:hypothetical protein
LASNFGGGSDALTAANSAGESVQLLLSSATTLTAAHRIHRQRKRKTSTLSLGAVTKMGVSLRSSRYFGPLLLIVATVGCAQSGANDVASPTGPSRFELSASSAESPASLDSTVATPMVGPPVNSYDATGSWHEVVTSRGQVQEDVHTLLTQHPDGTITHCGECEGELWTFTPVAVGPTLIVYSVTAVGDGSPCDFEVSGPARLSTTTNRITGTVTGQSDDCSQGTANFVLTRD